jgi:hypothetical protein
MEAGKARFCTEGVYMSSKEYLFGVVVVVLLFWGPLVHLWPVWIALRVGYLMAIPVGAWFLLEWIWKVWKPDAEAEHRLGSTLAGATSGVLVVWAHLEAIAKTHIDNDVVLPGPHWLVVLLLLIFAGFAFCLGVSKRDPWP